MKYYPIPRPPMSDAPRHADGRFIKYGVVLLVRVGLLRTANPVPAGYVTFRKEIGRDAYYCAHPAFAWLARAALWADRHKWALERWACHHGLMWMGDGDFYANARFRFPWRGLPSLDGCYGRGTAWGSPP